MMKLALTISSHPWMKLNEILYLKLGSALKHWLKSPIKIIFLTLVREIMKYISLQIKKFFSHKEDQRSHLYTVLSSVTFCSHWSQSLGKLGEWKTWLYHRKQSKLKHFKPSLLETIWLFHVIDCGKVKATFICRKGKK